MIGSKIRVDFTSQSEFHVSTCSKRLTIPENIHADELASSLRALTNAGKGKGKGCKSFTVV